MLIIDCIKLIKSPPNKLKILYVLWLILCTALAKKLYIYIIMQLKQFSNIEKYVKCSLQIIVHIIFNQ